MPPEASGNTVIGQPRSTTPGQINARISDYTREEKIAAARLLEAQKKADKEARELAAKTEKEAARKKLFEDRERAKNDRQQHELAKIEAKSAPLKTLTTLLTSVENIQRQVEGTQETVGAIGSVAASTSAKASAFDVKKFLPFIIIGGVLVVWFVFKRK